MSTPNNKAGRPSAGRTTGRSTTRTSGEGRVLHLKNPIDKNYLCAHICRCQAGSALRDALGREMKQRCTTAGVQIDEEAKGLRWRYKAEVGYNMRTNPPSPLMSAKDPHRPSRFPLGAASRIGLFKKDYEGRSQKGLLRIPDCIILKVSDAELAQMQATGVTNWERLIPVQRNIDTVVEIKFAGDELSPQQKIAYNRIAGPNRFRLLKASSCNCQERKQQTQEQTQSSPKPVNLGMPKSLAETLQGGVPPRRPQYGPELPEDEGIRLSDFLKSATVRDGILLVGTIALGIVLVPEAAALGGALLLINKAATQ